MPMHQPGQLESSGFQNITKSSSSVRTRKFLEDILNVFNVQ